MKNANLIAALIFILCTACNQQQQQQQQQNKQTQSTIADTTLGLSKTSVFDTPSPQPFSYNKNPPGSSTVLPRAYPGAPPQIPHSIEGFKPITAKNNACLGCHDNPSMRGKKVAGAPTAMPESHYVNQRNSPDKVGEKIVGARYVCTQCHVPQANVPPLVDNTFHDTAQP